MLGFVAEGVRDFKGLAPQVSDFDHKTHFLGHDIQMSDAQVRLEGGVEPVVRAISALTWGGGGKGGGKGYSPW